MRRVRDNEGDYEVYAEGVDSDGDGRYNEDGIGGLDLHRNYPENWRPMKEDTGRGQTQGGAGEYPLSEPETRAVFIFLMTHPNVAIVQSLDTAVPMILRGPSTSKSEETMFAADLELIRKFDAKGLEITGYPWAGDTTCMPPVAAQSDHRRAGAPAAAVRPRAGFRLLILRHRLVRQRDLERRSFRRLRQGRPVRRVGSAAMERREPPGQGRLQGLGGLRASDARQSRDWRFQPEVLFAEPAARHARNLGTQRGDVQLYLAQQLPQVRILSAAARKSGSTAAVFDVELSVTNEGKMPTSLEIARRVWCVRTAAPSRSEKVRAGPASRQSPRQRAAIEIDWLKPGENRREVAGKGAGRIADGRLDTRRRRLARARPALIDWTSPSRITADSRGGP